MNTQVLGISTDPIPTLRAWAESFGGIRYPLLSDFWPHGEIARQYGVLRGNGTTERALFLIDREGTIRYVDIHDIDLQPNNALMLDEIRKMDPEAARRENRPPLPVLPRGGIVIYCTPWCMDCRDLRAWLKLHSLPYTEVDIFTTDGAETQVRDWGGGGLITPTIDIDGEIIVDFDRERLRALLHVEE